METNRKKKIIQIGFIFYLLILLPSHSLYSQDTIYTKDGREIPVKIIESDDSYIKYKDYHKSDGIIRSFDTEYIDFIKYENGSIERFVVKIIIKFYCKKKIIRTNSYKENMKKI